MADQQEVLFDWFPQPTPPSRAPDPLTGEITSPVHSPVEEAPIDSHYLLGRGPVRFLAVDEASVEVLVPEAPLPQSNIMKYVGVKLVHKLQEGQEATPTHLAVAEVKKDYEEETVEVVRDRLQVSLSLLESLGKVAVPRREQDVWTMSRSEDLRGLMRLYMRMNGYGDLSIKGERSPRENTVFGLLLDKWSHFFIEYAGGGQKKETARSNAALVLADQLKTLDESSQAA